MIPTLNGAGYAVSSTVHISKTNSNKPV